MSAIIELMLAIRKDSVLFYHRDTKSVDEWPFSPKEMEHLSPERQLPLEDKNNIRLPSYKEVDHKEIMGFYVREFVEDKERRKTLFNILRRNEYIDAFIDKLHELELYEDFIDTCGDIYMQKFCEWKEKNNIEL